MTPATPNWEWYGEDVGKSEDGEDIKTSACHVRSQWQSVYILFTCILKVEDPGKMKRHDILFTCKPAPHYSTTLARCGVALTCMHVLGENTSHTISILKVDDACIMMRHELNDLGKKQRMQT